VNNEHADGETEGQRHGAIRILHIIGRAACKTKVRTVNPLKFSGVRHLH